MRGSAAFALGCAINIKPRRRRQRPCGRKASSCRELHHHLCKAQPFPVGLFFARFPPRWHGSVHRSLERFPLVMPVWGVQALFSLFVRLLSGSPSKSCNDAGLRAPGCDFRLAGGSDWERDHGWLDDKPIELVITVVGLQRCNNNRVLLLFETINPE